MQPRVHATHAARHARVRVVRVGDAWAIRTAPDLGFLMQKETVETRKLSRAAMETLAIIAYHEPVSRAEIAASPCHCAGLSPGVPCCRPALAAPCKARTQITD